MADVVNLNRARKQRARKAEKTTAAENRAAFGRTKAERELDKARARKTARDLDGARRDD